MITLLKTKNDLKTKGLTLNDNTLKELRTYLYFLGELQIEEEKAKEGRKVCAE